MHEKLHHKEPDFCCWSFYTDNLIILLIIVEQCMEDSGNHWFREDFLCDKGSEDPQNGRSHKPKLEVRPYRLEILGLS